MDEPEVRAYLRFGLRLGRLADGVVDCWFGDPALRREVEGEPLARPADLAREATGLLARVADSGLAPERKRYLRAHLVAMRCAALRMSGEPVSFHDEVRAYFRVDVAMGDQDHYAEAHDELRALLPGTGDLRDRLERFHEDNTVGPEHLQRAVQAVSDALRSRVRARHGLPEREHVRYRVVHEKPWHAFNRYLGDYRSEVMLDSRAGRNLGALPLLATHESYPGHHTEHCLKEAGLVAGRGADEHALVLVNTPRCLVSEGMAEVALDACLGDGWGAWTSAVLAEQGVRVQGERVEAVMRSWWKLMGARQDAAIMLHDRGASAEEAAAHLGRWLLVPEQRAGHMVEFLTDPLWRAYTVGYVEGRRLVAAWLAARTDDESAGDRFDRLLRTAFLPDDLRVRAATGSPGRGVRAVVPTTPLWQPLAAAGPVEDRAADAIRPSTRDAAGGPRT